MLSYSPSKVGMRWCVNAAGDGLENLKWASGLSDDANYKQFVLSLTVCLLTISCFLLLSVLQTKTDDSRHSLPPTIPYTCQTDQFLACNWHWGSDSQINCAVFSIKCVKIIQQGTSKFKRHNCTTNFAIMQIGQCVQSWRKLVYIPMSSIA